MRATAAFCGQFSPVEVAAGVAAGSGATMGVLGVTAFTMGAVGLAASFGFLWAYRGGDAKMRSAWICTRNDVRGNLAVLLAALGVLGTGTGWPDVIVAVIMAALALQGAWTILNQSQAELRISTVAVS